MLMTASDLAASTKPWPVQRRVAELVTAEFFAQVRNAFSVYTLPLNNSLFTQFGIKEENN